MQGKSGVFFAFLDILHHTHKVNPQVKFLLENVRGSKKGVDVITESLEVDPLFINSRWFCAQNRPRLYWTNIDVNMDNIPDNQETVKDILEDGVPEQSKLTPGRWRWLNSESARSVYRINILLLTQRRLGVSPREVMLLGTVITSQGMERLLG